MPLTKKRWVGVGRNNLKVFLGLLGFEGSFEKLPPSKPIKAPKFDLEY